RGSPEHGQPLVQRRALALLGIGDRLDRLAVAGLDGIADDQPEVDVTDQVAEAAVGEAAQRVRGDQAVSEGGKISVGRLGQHTLAVHYDHIRPAPFYRAIACSNAWLRSCCSRGAEGRGNG